MGRAVVRRHAGLSAVLGAALLLAGCGQDPASLPTAADYATAERAWSDPWLAPASATVPEAGWGSPDGYVQRETGTRTTRYTTGGPAQALRREVVAATARGWRLTGLTCATPAASLVRGTGVDDGLAATVQVSGTTGAVDALVTGIAPHHLDGAWPAVDAPALDLAGSCLAGGPERALREDSLGTPYDAREAEDPEHTTWRRDVLSGPERRLAAAVAADPWVREAGLAVGTGRLAADDARRRAPVGTLTLPRPLAEVVAAMGDWQVTWAACGPGRVTELTARLRTDDGPAVARLTGIAGSTTVTVTLPLPEAPAPAAIEQVPALTDPPCLAAPPAADTVAGTPVATVSVSQPVSG